MMDNFSNISLSSEKLSLRKRISSLRKSMDAIKVKGSDYYEHHQRLINTYKEMVDVIDRAIEESQDVGRGV